MNTKKISGFVLLAFAAASGFLLFGNLSHILSQLPNLGMLLSGSLSSYDAGRVVGASALWIVNLAVTVSCLVYGFRLVTSTSQEKVS